jgi:hypothetical protein
MSVFVDLLQDRDRFIKEIVDGVAVGRKILALTLVSVACLALYGVIIGSQYSWLQALSSGVKLPILFLLTNAICLPTLFIFGSFFGSKRSAMQTAALLLAGTAVIGIVLVGFAPVTVFFTVTTKNYQFLKILNVGFFSIAGILGILFFNRFLAESMEAGAQPVRARGLFLRFWFLLYAFVGTQLAWTLRPFFGAPDMRFEFLRELGGNFYSNVFQSLGHLFGAQ